MLNADGRAAGFLHELREPVSDRDLLRVHTKHYLESLAKSSVVATALELPLLRLAPSPLIRSRLLTPMRLAVAGTMAAVDFALSTGGVALNFGGGYHHAFPDHGEGFCLFADVAVAIASARANGTLRPTDPVAIIDLDAHRGNGVFAIFGNDEAVRIFDLYNFQNYPGSFPGDPDRYPYQIPVKAGTADEGYLRPVREDLPEFLDQEPRLKLAIYNAGTDVVAGDKLGGLAVSAAGVAERDRLVIDELARREIPTAIVTSGGYSAQSHRLIARLGATLLSVPSS